MLRVKSLSASILSMLLLPILVRDFNLNIANGIYHNIIVASPTGKCRSACQGIIG